MFRQELCDVLFQHFDYVSIVRRSVCAIYAHALTEGVFVDVQSGDHISATLIEDGYIIASMDCNDDGFTGAHILTGQIIHNSYGAIMFRSGLT